MSARIRGGSSSGATSSGSTKLDATTLDASGTALRRIYPAGVRPSWTALARLLLLWLIGLLCLAILYLLVMRVMMPVHQEEMAQTQIYAYRGWQSTGVRLQAGDTAVIRAQGEWLYTPGEWHDANGHKRYPAPTFYPMTGVAGGVLLGRVGDNGSIQLVGTRGRVYTSTGGMLYLRINDDILSDNEGSLQVTVEVIPAAERDGG